MSLTPLIDQLIVQINEHLPSHAVVVDVLKNGLQPFYTQYGFQRLDIHQGETRLFLSMKAVRGLFGW